MYASNFFVGTETKNLFCITFLIILFQTYYFQRESSFLFAVHQVFPTSDILKYHLRVHSERHFRCSLCDKSFKDSSRLRIHIRAHKGEKPFFDQNLFQDNTSEAHSRTHAGEKPFICTLCPMSFARPGYLKAHSRNHTGQRTSASHCVRIHSGNHHHGKKEKIYLCLVQTQTRIGLLEEIPRSGVQIPCLS